MEKRLIDELQAIIDGLAARLGQSVAVDAPDGELIAVTKDYGDADPYRVNLLLQRRMPDEARAYFVEHMNRSTPGHPVRVPQNTELSIEARWCYNLGDSLAFLWILDRGTPLDESVIARYAERIVATLAQRSTVEPVDRRNQRRASVERALLGATGHPNPEANSSEMLTVVCAAAPAHDSTREAPEAFTESLRAAQIFGFTSVARMENEGFLVAVLGFDERAAGDYEQAIADLQAVANRFPGVGAIGIAGTGDLTALRRLFARAATAQIIGSEVSASEPFVLWEHVSHIASGVDLEHTQAAATRVVKFARLLQDTEDFTFETTAALFRARHGAGPASILQLHRTTILYRQKQICRLTGIDLTRESDRYLAFTQWLHELCRRRLSVGLRSELATG